MSQEGFLLKKVDTFVEKDKATRAYVHAFGNPLPRTCEGVEIDLGRRLVTVSASFASSFALLAARSIHGPDKQMHRHKRVIQGIVAHSRHLSLLSLVSLLSLLSLLPASQRKGRPIWVGRLCSTKSRAPR